MKFNYLIYLLLIAGTLRAQSPKDYAVQLQAVVTETPPSISLSWPMDNDSKIAGYQVFRKSKTDSSWGNLVIALPKNASQWKDENVSAGNSYEYYVRRSYTNDINRVAHGYIYAGINLPEVNYRGTILLLVDKNYALPLVTEIDQLKSDLIEDGWQVKHFDIARTDAVATVKNIIRLACLADTTINALYLLGHIPVPYSGGFKVAPGKDYPPDGHPEHGGAWPADLYYGTFNEKVWTDTLVNDNSPSRDKNDNIIGDGKFDTTYIFPAAVQLQIGRVDLTDMPGLNRNDTLLTKKYLDRAHAYKKGLLKINKRALIDDNLGLSNGESIAAAGWRNFSTMFGDSVFARDYFTSVQKGNYQFAFGCGQGAYDRCLGVGNYSDYNNDSLDIIFSSVFGSYFGDWDSQNNLLRAALCAKQPVLASFWNGRPNWNLHHMSLGETIGYSARLTQSNYYVFQGARHIGYFPGFGTTRVHIALMGDPTLRLDPVKGPSQLKTTETNDSLTVSLSWNVVAAAEGYIIYKRNSPDGKFIPLARLTAADTTYTDNAPDSGANFYMVRSLLLEKTPSGTYYNLSLGVRDSIVFTKKSDPPAPPPASEVLDLIVTLFPNPTTGLLEVRLANWFNRGAEVVIADMAGRKVLTAIVSSGRPRLSLHTLTGGVYLVTVIQRDRSITQRIVLQTTR